MPKSKFGLGGFVATSFGSYSSFALFWLVRKQLVSSLNNGQTANQGVGRE